jgi:8-oxo-dGTP pyrophosphatase MutT (NUDIX family)
MEAKWRVVRSRTLVKDRWIDLRADDCLTPAGRDISPFYVLSYPDWVHVVAVTPDERLVLVRQYRHGVGEMVLELPGGMMDATDDLPEQAARRELAEESGYRSDDWQLISSLYPNPASQTNRLHAFLARDAVADVAPALDAGEEGMQHCTLPLDEVLAGLRSGLLGQSLQVSSVLLALMMIGRVKA